MIESHVVSAKNPSMLSRRIGSIHENRKEVEKALRLSAGLITPKGRFRCVETTVQVVFQGIS